MNQTTDANAIFAPIWKRKWLILIVGLLVAAGSYYYYQRKPKIYSASTQVYLGNGAEEQQQLASSGGGSGKKAATADPATQALLINSSIIKDAVHARLRKEHKNTAVRAALKGKVKAKSATKSEFITIGGEAHNARGAALLVNFTAQEYIKRQNAHHHREVQDALGLARRQLAKIEAGAAVRASSKSKSSKSSSSATATQQQDQPAGSQPASDGGGASRSRHQEGDQAVVPSPKEQRDLRLRDRPVAGGACRLPTQQARPAPAFAVSNRIGLPGADIDCATGREASSGESRRTPGTGEIAARGVVATADDAAGGLGIRQRRIQQRARVRASSDSLRERRCRRWQVDARRHTCACDVRCG